MTTDGLDAGAANERTALAWQRTALGLLAGSAVLARLTFEHLGPLALTGLAVALPLSVWVFLEGRGRYDAHTGLRPRPRPRGGRAATALTVVTVVVGLTELASLLVR